MTYAVPPLRWPVPQHVKKCSFRISDQPDVIAVHEGAGTNPSETSFIVFQEFLLAVALLARVVAESSARAAGVSYEYAVSRPAMAVKSLMLRMSRNPTIVERKSRCFSDFRTKIRQCTEDGNPKNTKAFSSNQSHSDGARYFEDCLRRTRHRLLQEKNQWRDPENLRTISPMAGAFTSMQTSLPCITIK